MIRWRNYRQGPLRGLLMIIPFVLAAFNARKILCTQNIGYYVTRSSQTVFAADRE